MFGDKIKGLFTTVINAPQKGIEFLKGLQLDIYEELGALGSEAESSAKNFYAGEAGSSAGVWLSNNWQKAGFSLVIVVILISVLRGK